MFRNLFPAFGNLFPAFGDLLSAFNNLYLTLIRNRQVKFENSPVRITNLCTPVSADNNKEKPQKDGCDTRVSAINSDKTTEEPARKMSNTKGPADTIQNHCTPPLFLIICTYAYM